MPTLSQHVPHSAEQNQWMVGDIPEERIHVHDWMDDCPTLGVVPAAYVRAITDGAADWDIADEISDCFYCCNNL